MDASFFYNDYDKLRTSTVENDPESPDRFRYFSNTSQGSSYGLELAVDWQARPWLELQLAYTFLQLDLDTIFDINDLDFAATNEDSSPNHQLSLRSGIDLGKNWQLNLWLRYVDQFAASGYIAIAQDLQIDDYFAFDANISWKPSDSLELMLVAQNLFTSDRLEFISEVLAPVAEVETSAYGKIIFHF